LTKAYLHKYQTYINQIFQSLVDLLKVASPAKTKVGLK
jgi:hypothetical protein